MGLFPRSKIERVQYLESRLDSWETNALALGSTVATITDLTTKTATARSLYNDLQAALIAAKNATLAFNAAVGTMTADGMGVVKQIRAKAELVGGDSVYVLASIPPPANPTPIGELGTPSDFVASLTAQGVLALSWKCSNPRSASGTTYEIWRSLTGSDGDFSYIGGSGQKAYNDATVPAGTSAVTYQIRAIRSTGIGPFATFNVKFGVGTSGGMTASVVAPTAGRKAA